jgi:DNA-binding winged helix-turn-helix (wHTH) protein
VIYRFDEFEVDDREFRLSADGATVQVEPKVLRLLLYLIQNRNRLVRKQELLDSVWPDAMVTENALTRVVGLLRKALNDDSHVPRFIATVPTAGYRFIARVTVAEQNPVTAPLAPTETTSATATSATRFRASRRWTFAAVFLLLAAVSGGIFLTRQYNRPTVRQKATIVLADFDNATGDQVFDSTLRQGLAMRLEQSPCLTLMSNDRIQIRLRMMAQPPNARLTPAIAQEICVRSSSAAVVDGSIANLGSQYVLDYAQRTVAAERLSLRTRCGRSEKKMYWVPWIKLPVN